MVDQSLEETVNLLEAMLNLRPKLILEGHWVLPEEEHDARSGPPPSSNCG